MDLEIKSLKLLDPLGREWYLNPHINASNVRQANVVAGTDRKRISGLMGYGWAK